MTVEEVQDAFAALREDDIGKLPPELRKGVASARQELDAIRFGMCKTGQAGEIRRIFADLDALMVRPS